MMNAWVKLMVLEKSTKYRKSTVWGGGSAAVWML